VGVKKEWVIAMNYAKYLAFILATVCVLIFQFTAYSIWITMALSFYVVAFGLMFGSMVIHCVEIYNADKIVRKNHLTTLEPELSPDGTIVPLDGEYKGKEVEVVSLKSEKVWSVLGAIFFALFTVFTFAVLVLY